MKVNSKIVKGKILSILFIFLFTIFFSYAVFPCVVTISNISTNSVYGSVVTETKEIITGAKIQIYKNTAKGEEILAETESDVNGRFEIKNFSAGKYLIRANAEHFTYSYAFMKLKKSSSIKNKEIVFTLLPVGGCSGWVKTQKIQKSN